MEEKWETIEEFPVYAISTEGVILNESTGRFMVANYNTNGMLKVGLVKGGKQYTRAVCVLVAETFVPGRNEIYDTIIYLDGDRNNIRADNLVWRPRWFALEHRKQFLNESENNYIGPIRDITTGNHYKDVYEAGVTHGLLFSHIRRSLGDHETVFPTFMRFELI